MKNKLLFFCMLTFLFAKAQENIIEKGRLDIVASGKIGVSQLNSLEYKNLSGTIQSGNVSGRYHFNEKVNLSFGIGLMDFNANVISDSDLASLRNQFLHIPLRAGMGYSFDKDDPFFSRVKFVFGVGLFGNYHLNQTIENISFSDEIKWLGWNFGLLTDFGIEIDVAQDLALSIFLESHFANENFARNDEMRLENNMIGISLIYRFLP